MINQPQKSIGSLFSEFGGYTAIPNTLLENRVKLKLSSSDLLVIENVLRFQYNSNSLPYPSTETISTKTGLSIPTVWRIKAKLVRSGFLISRPLYTKKVKELSSGRKEVEYCTGATWDFSGLWNKLYNIGKPQVKLEVVRSVPPITSDSTPTITSDSTPLSQTIDEEDEYKKTTNKEDYIGEAYASHDSDNNNDLTSGPSDVVEKTPKTKEEDMSETIEERKARAIKLGEKASKEAEELEEKKRKKRAASGKTKKPRVPNTGPTAIAYSTWLSAMNRAFPGHVISKWGPKELNMVRVLISKYDLDTVTRVLEYVPDRWDALNKKIFNGTAIAPTLSMIVKLHESLFAEAQMWVKYKKLLIKVNQWTKENPDEFEMPDDLKHDAQEMYKLKTTLGL